MHLAVFLGFRPVERVIGVERLSLFEPRLSVCQEWRPLTCFLALHLGFIARLEQDEVGADVAGMDEIENLFDSALRVSILRDETGAVAFQAVDVSEDVCAFGEGPGQGWGGERRYGSVGVDFEVFGVEVLGGR